jgi:hypothetical protein
VDTSTALVTVGAGLQVLAVIYVTADVWKPAVAHRIRPPWLTFKRLLADGRERVWRYLRRALHIRRTDRAVILSPVSGTGSASFDLKAHRGRLPQTASTQEQIEWLAVRIDLLLRDADARRAQIDQVEAELRAQIAAAVDVVTAHVEGRFEISARKAFISGVLAIVGTALITIGDLTA